MELIHFGLEASKYKLKIVVNIHLDLYMHTIDQCEKYLLKMLYHYEFSNYFHIENRFSKKFSVQTADLLEKRNIIPLYSP